MSINGCDKCGSVSSCYCMSATDVETQEQPSALPACMQAPYAAMMAESERIGWPTAYQRDLTVHDVNYLAQYQPDEFLWIVRDSGTHLFSPSDGRPLESALQWLTATVRTYGLNNLRMYIWRNGALSEVMHEDAREWTCQSFPHKVPYHAHIRNAVTGERAANQSVWANKQQALDVAQIQADIVGEAMGIVEHFHDGMKRTATVYPQTAYQAPVLYAVTAQIEYTSPEGYTSSRQVPSFLLNANTFGIFSEHDACSIAMRILGAFNAPTNDASLKYHVCAVKL